MLTISIRMNSLNNTLLKLSSHLWGTDELKHQYRVSDCSKMKTIICQSSHYLLHLNIHAHIEFICIGLDLQKQHKLRWSESIYKLTLRWRPIDKFARAHLLGYIFVWYINILTFFEWRTFYGYDTNRVYEAHSCKAPLYVCNGTRWIVDGEGNVQSSSLTNIHSLLDYILMYINAVCISILSICWMYRITTPLS